MIDLVVLIFPAQRLGAAAKPLGRKAFLYRLLLVAFWFLGEIVATLLAALALQIFGYRPEHEHILLRLMSLFGAAIGAWFAFHLAQRPNRSSYATCQKCGERLSDLSHPCPVCGSFERTIDGEPSESESNSRSQARRLVNCVRQTIHRRSEHPTRWSDRRINCRRRPRAVGMGSGGADGLGRASAKAR